MTEMMSIYRPVCAICDRGFSAREWVNRHEVVDGPCHEVCCDDPACDDEDEL